MIELVRTIWNGQPHYHIEHDGPNKAALRRQETRVPITEAQAAKGVDYLAVRFEDKSL